MNKNYKYLIPVFALVLAAGTTFAAKPENRTNKGNAFGKMTKDAKALAKNAFKLAKMEAKQNKQKNVLHVYFYDLASNSDAKEYNYTDKAWGKMVVITKHSKFNFVGHNLESGKTYSLYADNHKVGEAVANGGGNLHIKGVYTSGDGDKASDWVLKKGDDIKLRGFDHKIKHQPADDGDDD